MSLLKGGVRQVVQRSRYLRHATTAAASSHSSTEWATATGHIAEYDFGEEKLEPIPDHEADLTAEEVLEHEQIRLEEFWSMQMSEEVGEAERASYAEKIKHIRDISERTHMSQRVTGALGRKLWSRLVDVMTQVAQMDTPASMLMTEETRRSVALKADTTLAHVDMVQYCTELSPENLEFTLTTPDMPPYLLQAVDSLLSLDRVSQMRGQEVVFTKKRLMAVQRSERTGFVSTFLPFLVQHYTANPPVFNLSQKGEGSVSHELLAPHNGKTLLYVDEFPVPKLLLQKVFERRQKIEKDEMQICTAASKGADLEALDVTEPVDLQDFLSYETAVQGVLGDRLLEDFTRLSFADMPQRLAHMKAQSGGGGLGTIFPVGQWTAQPETPMQAFSTASFTSQDMASIFPPFREWRISDRIISAPTRPPVSGAVEVFRLNLGKGEVPIADRLGQLSWDTQHQLFLCSKPAEDEEEFFPEMFHEKQLVHISSVHMAQTIKGDLNRLEKACIQANQNMAIDFYFVTGKVHAGEDETLASVTQRTCGKVIDAFLHFASSGMSAQNNYNKTSVTAVKGDDQARSVFMIPLPLNLSFTNNPIDYLAVLECYVSELTETIPPLPGGRARLEKELQSMRMEAGTDRSVAFLQYLLSTDDARKSDLALLHATSLESITDKLHGFREASMVLRCVAGNLRITSTSQDGPEELRNYLVSEAFRAALRKTGDVGNLHDVITRCYEEVTRDSLNEAGSRSTKWDEALTLSLLTRKNIEKKFNHIRSDIQAEGVEETCTRLDKTVAATLAGNIDGGSTQDGTSTAVTAESRSVPHPVLEELVTFCIISGQMFDDKYIKMTRLISSAARAVRVAELSNWKSRLIEDFALEKEVFNPFLKNEEILPRHYQLAAVICDLMLDLPFKGYRPFSLQHVTAQNINHQGKAGESRTLLVVRVDPCVLDVDNLMHGHMVDADYPPMLCPPDSWAKHTDKHPLYPSRRGGSPYKTLPADLLRGHSGSAWLTNGLLKVTEPALDRTPLISSLDFMSAVPWKVSEVAVDHLTRIKQSGEDYGDKLKGGWVPLEPPKPRFRTTKSMKMWETQVGALQTKTVQRSTALSQGNRILTLLERFKHQAVHLPCNCDFRGRTYPMHTAMNYQASDFVRCSLEFADKRPLGPTGLVHLKIHAANLMGLDKQSFNTRIQWCDDNVERIAEMLERPYADDAVWREADKPLLGFVVLHELGRALSDSISPDHYETGVPIHVDGSCNGLQHYSALALDKKGAATANLGAKTWDEKPSDIYTTVLEVVKERNLEKIEEGGEQAEMAALLHPLLKRKTVKQSVMTNVYGVTMHGMKDQILGQLIAQTESLAEPPPRPLLSKMARYTAVLIQRSLSDVFKGAIETQKWFGEVLQVINEVHQSTHIAAPPITFVSPAGTPVAQPYFLDETVETRVKIGNSTIGLHSSTLGSNTKFLKQRTAFPPNFVHSMDATHVHLTTDLLKKRGVTSFGAVHDSYWGHPADMDTLNSTLREAFIHLYTPNRLESLYLDLSSAHGKALVRAGASLPLPPPRGDFDLNEVMDSPYFFA